MFNMCIRNKIHSKNQTCRMKLILLLPTNALHTECGIDGLCLQRNAALVRLHI